MERRCTHVNRSRQADIEKACISVGVIALETKIGAHVELAKAADELRRLVFIDEQGVVSI